MKKVLLIVAVLMALLIATPAMAIEWGANGSTVAWDASKLSDGSPIPSTDDPTLYEVFVKNASGAGSPIFIGDTTALSYPINLNNDGLFYAGVRAVRMFEGAPIVIEGKRLESPFTWSNSTDPVAVPVPFGLTSWLNLQAPKGLRMVQ